MSKKMMGSPGLKSRDAITQALIAELNEIDPYKKVTRMRMLVIGLVDLATGDNPDLGAIKEIYDRVEGRARQQVDVTHDGDVAVRSAALSLLASLVDEATGQGANPASAKSLPN